MSSSSSSSTVGLCFTSGEIPACRAIFFDMCCAPNMRTGAHECDSEVKKRTSSGPGERDRFGCLPDTFAENGPATAHEDALGLGFVMLALEEVDARGETLRRGFGGDWVTDGAGDEPRLESREERRDEVDCQGGKREWPM